MRRRCARGVDPERKREIERMIEAEECRGQSDVCGRLDSKIDRGKKSYTNSISSCEVGTPPSSFSSSFGLCSSTELRLLPAALGRPRISGSQPGEWALWYLRPLRFL